MRFRSGRMLQSPSSKWRSVSRRLSAAFEIASHWGPGDGHRKRVRPDRRRPPCSEADREASRSRSTNQGPASRIDGTHEGSWRLQVSGSRAHETWSDRYRWPERWPSEKQTVPDGGKPTTPARGLEPRRAQRATLSVAQAVAPTAASALQALTICFALPSAALPLSAARTCAVSRSGLTASNSAAMPDT